MNTGSVVKINDRTDWHGLCGIIDVIQGDTAFIFCVSRPGKLHPVSLEELIDCEL